MVLEINGKEYELRFGIDFIRELDKKYTVSEKGITFGMGVDNTLVGLLNQNPIAICEIIQAATHYLSSQPSLKNIEAWVEEQEDFEKVCDDFLEKYKTASFTKKKTEAVLKEMGRSLK